MRFFIFLHTLVFIVLVTSAGVVPDSEFLKSTIRVSSEQSVDSLFKASINSTVNVQFTPPNEHRLKRRIKGKIVKKEDVVRISSTVQVIDSILYRELGVSIKEYFRQAHEQYLKTRQKGRYVLMQEVDTMVMPVRFAMKNGSGMRCIAIVQQHPYCCTVRINFKNIIEFGTYNALIAFLEKSTFVDYKVDTVGNQEYKHVFINVR